MPRTASRTSAQVAVDFGAGFCTGQRDAGAFGRASARRIVMGGTRAGDLRDGVPHAITLASVFCIASTGDLGIDAVSGLRGAGAVSSAGSSSSWSDPARSPRVVPNRH
jgi:hypothetical protein